MIEGKKNKILLIRLKAVYVFFVGFFFFFLASLWWVLIDGFLVIFH